MWQEVLISLFVLVGVMLLYFQVVRALKVLDNPNPRSSHYLPTLRGGGIIFPVALLLFSALSNNEWKWWTIGVVLVAIVSFWDDWREISAKLRLIVYALGAGLLILELGIWQQSVLYGFGLLILFTGIINAYNFMDGINGITGGYSSVWLISLLFLHHKLATHFPELFFYILLIALLIFNILNFRKNAICFAGDVGAISIALILLFPTFWLISVTGSWIFLLLLAVYGVDSVLTIMYRIKKGENIFRAHRHHIYQNLANEWKWGHLWIAILYCVLQLIINILIFQFYTTPIAVQWTFGIVLLSLLAVTYYLVKKYTGQRFGFKDY